MFGSLVCKKNLRQNQKFLAEVTRFWAEISWHVWCQKSSHHLLQDRPKEAMPYLKPYYVHKIDKNCGHQTLILIYSCLSWFHKVGNKYSNCLVCLFMLQHLQFLSLNQTGPTAQRFEVLVCQPIPAHFACSAQGAQSLLEFAVASLWQLKNRWYRSWRMGGFVMLSTLLLMKLSFVCMYCNICNWFVLTDYMRLTHLLQVLDFSFLKYTQAWSLADHYHTLLFNINLINGKLGLHKNG